LLRDISDVFLKEKVNATKANTISKNGLALMRFTIEVSDRDQLSRLLALVQQLPSVIEARYLA